MLFYLSLLCTFIGLSNFANDTLLHVVQGDKLKIKYLGFYFQRPRVSSRLFIGAKLCSFFVDGT